jgi:hypothetical protein
MAGGCVLGAGPATFATMGSKRSPTTRNRVRAKAGSPFVGRPADIGRPANTVRGKAGSPAIRALAGRPRPPDNDSGLDPKTKLSVSIAASDIAWVTERAAERGVPVSAIFQEALELYRRDWKLEHLIKVTGGSDDITEADIEAVRDEYRALGIRT